MNYQEALAYIYSFSDFERSGTYTRDRNENLPRIARLLDVLGNPHQRYSNTLIAGTKGKGSTAALVERVLRQAGVQTGLYTQPDLHTFRERIKVNGQLISEEETALLIPEIATAVKTIQEQQEFGPFITYEIGTALAFLYFARRGVEHAVVEVGLGGRLDATNVTTPLVSVITSISYDHMNVLGNTLTKIATEKAGIIKPHGVIVTSAQSPEALLAIAQVSEQRAAHLVRTAPLGEDAAQDEVDAGLLPAPTYTYEFLSQDKTGRQRFRVHASQQTYEDLEIPLVGRHQIENASAALATLEVLRQRGITWNEQDLRRGFSEVHWPARIEVVGTHPTIVVDGAHNADSMQKLVQALRSSFAPQRLLFVLSTSQDKDLPGMLQALADIDILVLTQMHNVRSNSIERLRDLSAVYIPQVKVYTAPDSEQAMNLAVKLASPDDLICAAGSLYLAGEALRWAAAHGAANAAAEIEGIDH